MRLDSVVVATREGPVEVTSAGRDVLVEEIRSRGSDDDVALTLETAGGSGPVDLGREGKIVVFDALWSLADRAGADRAGADEPLDPQLSLLRRG